ncbi:MAG: CAP domain-containing protein [Ruminiclostridium sp.]
MKKIIAAFLIAAAVVTAPALSDSTSASPFCITAEAASAKLSKPSSLKASVSGKKITLSWNKVSGADAYRVYRYNATKKKYVKVKDVTGTKISINVSKYGDYKFLVRSLDKKNGKYILGNYSSVSVTVKDLSKVSAEEAVAEIVNSERKAAGKSALTLDSKLCEAAEIRAKEIAEYFSHDRPDGSACFTVFEELGIRYGAAGENIAAGQRSASEVMESWMNSSGHRQNILSSNFRKIGIGLYKSPDGYGYYWVQIFSD